MFPRVKKCKKCSKTKPLTDFWFRKDAKDGHASWCKECGRKDNRQRYANRTPEACEKGKTSRKEWAERNPEKIVFSSRKGELKFKYGLTIDEYNNLFIQQNGCCAICGRHQSEFIKRLGVDHNHETGEIRGLLCNNCNKGIGNFHENQDFLEEAIRYLTKEKTVV